MPQLPSNRRRVRRHERARRRRFLAGAGVAIVLLAMSLVRLSRIQPVAVRAAEPPTPHTVLTLPTEPVERSEFNVERLTYPFAIVAGGAETIGELRKAIAADPVVRAHYADFELAKTHVVRLTTARVAHVSYRLGNAVFWTRRAVLLNAGETLLTDGEHYARTRCGNQLATAPAAMSPNEPSVELLNTPLTRPAI